MTRDERKAAQEKEAHDKIQRLHDEIVAEVAKRGGALDPDAVDFDPTGWAPADHFHFEKDDRGPKVSVQVKYTADHSGRFFNREATGKVRIKVGDYGNVRQFPDRAKGHNIPGIVQAILDRASTEKASRTKRVAEEKQEDAAYARATAMNQRCGVPYIPGYRAGTTIPDGAHAIVRDRQVVLDHGDLTEAEVEAVLDFIVKLKKK